MAHPDRSLDSVERLFAAIRATHAVNPDLRVGQIIANAIRNEGVWNCDPFHWENASLTDSLDKMLRGESAVDDSGVWTAPYSPGASDPRKNPGVGSTTPSE
jgi:hypothetical protein